MNEPPDSAAANAHIRFVLANTSHPGNIGSSARAIRTMGFSQLSLVAPAAFPHVEASALAAGADDVLEQAPIHLTLADAVADCTLVLGATARMRGVVLREYSPRQTATLALQHAAAGRQVAIVFGNERAGLSNEEIKLCHAAVHIPSDPGFSSLNLSQAVQVLAYELRMAVLDGVSPLQAAQEAPASNSELEGFFQHLATTLDDIEFHKGRSPFTIMRRLRRIFLRAEPDSRELRILRGILTDAQRMARLAHEQK